MKFKDSEVCRTSIWLHTNNTGFVFLLKDYQKYQAKVLKLQEREKTPQNQAKLDAVRYSIHVISYGF